MLFNGFRFCLILLLIGFSQFVLAGFNNRVSQQVTSSVSQAVSKNLFKRLVPQLKIKNSSGKVIQMQLSSTGKYLSLLFEDQSIRAWDLDYGVQRPAIQSSVNALANHLDEKNGIFYILDQTHIIGYDILTAARESELFLNNIEASDFVLLEGGNSFLLSNETGLELFDRHANNKLWSQKQFAGDVKKIVTDRTNARWASLIRQETFFSSNDWVEVGDLKTGNRLYKLENNGTEVIFLGFGRSANELRVGYENGQVMVWDLTQGLKSAAIKLADNDLVLMDISVAGAITYLNDSGSLVVTDMQQKKSKTFDIRDKGILQLLWINDGQTIATADSQGQVLFWNVTSGDDFLQLIATTEGWTVVDKKGRFDSSEKGMLNVSWQVKDTVIPLDSFSQNYYEPGLLASYLKGRKFINPDSLNVLDGINIPPLAKIIEPVLNNRQSSGSEPLLLHIIGQGMGGGLKRFLSIIMVKKIKCSKD